MPNDRVHRPDSTGNSASSGGGGSGAASDPRAGTYFLGRYRVVDEIGIGGMASVHLARMDGLGGFQKWVAIKKIHAHLLEDESFVQMFLDEARIVARISHSNVATVFELGKHEDCYWIAMEYLHGEPLRELMRRTEELGTPMPPEIACRVIADAAEGLHAAHELVGKNGEKLQLVHRDVTPHNLFVTYDGTTKVVDFGIAKFASRISNTRAGTLKGKLAYMSPEQVHGEPIDRRTDLFALGVVLWELTTGQRLFRMDNDLDTLAKVQECNVPRPSTLVRGYPIDLEKIVMKVLARNRNERFKTARELSRALQSLLMRRGLFIASDEVASYVQSIFAERIQKREAHLRWAAEVTQTINVESLRLPEGGVSSFDHGLHPAFQPDAKVSSPGPARLPAPRPAAGVPARREQGMLRTAETPSLETPATSVRPYDDGPTLQGSLPDFGYQGGEELDDDDTLVAKGSRSGENAAVTTQPGQVPLPAAGRPVDPFHVPDARVSFADQAPAAASPFALPQQSPFPGDFAHQPTVPAQPNPFMPELGLAPAAAPDPRWPASMGAPPQPPPVAPPDHDNRTRTARSAKQGIPMWVVALGSGLLALLFVGAIYVLLSGTLVGDKSAANAAGAGTEKSTALPPPSAGAQGPFGNARDAFTAAIAPTTKATEPVAPALDDKPAAPAPPAPSADPTGKGAGGSAAAASASAAPAPIATSPAATPTSPGGKPKSETTRSDLAKSDGPTRVNSGPVERRAEKTGLLTVICKPSPCDEVFDNGKPLGASPIYRQSVSVGEHRLTLKTSNPPVTKTQRTTVAADELNIQQVTMTP
ncbi:protein kinase domain-containing protein [Pendulispora albinea]|uniref:Protein kinase n=1 Tax=Pendulispora albinea TaxID=2741071 RepID=A0ABZ2M2G3_9BACT